MHLIDVLQALPAARLRAIPVARLVADFVGVVFVVFEERRAEAAVTVLETEELGAAHVLAKLPTKLDGHRLTVLFGDVVTIVPPLCGLDVVLAADVPEPGDATLRVDIEWAVERGDLGQAQVALAQAMRGVVANVGGSPERTRFGSRMPCVGKGC
jgi:hypothetical protein